jgi:hypothetical protein
VIAGQQTPTSTTSIRLMTELTLPGGGGALVGSLSVFSGGASSASSWAASGSQVDGRYQLVWQKLVNAPYCVLAITESARITRPIDNQMCVKRKSERARDEQPTRERGTHASGVLVDSLGR